LNKSLNLNIFSTILNVLITGIVYFFVYKLLYSNVGIQQLGVWSIVLASSSIANLANFGLTSSVVKYVAGYNAKGLKIEISKLIFTSFILMLAIFVCVSLLVYLGSEFILLKVIPLKYFSLAESLLPYSLICLVLNALGGVFSSGLEGFQKNYVRNLIYITGSVTFLLLSFLFIPEYGLMGVAYAQLIQSIFIFVASFVSLKIVFKDFILFKWQWDKLIFKEIFGYGIKFQVISLSQIFYDPTTKMLLTEYGGLTMVGYYEIASRLVMQVRSIIVSANQVMVPVIADLKESNVSKIADLYKQTLPIVILFTIVVLSFLLSVTDLISFLWIQEVSFTFWNTVFFLILAMVVNIISSPAYFTLLGLGNLNPLLWSHVLMGILNFILGIIGGVLWGGNGVILGWIIAVLIGSLIVINSFEKKYLNNRKLDKDILLLISGFIINSLIIVLIKFYCISDYNLLFLLSTLTYVVVFSPILFVNKTLKSLLTKFLNKV
jgi:O-antigen/teichoic acid export membrane protein